MLSITSDGAVAVRARIDIEGNSCLRTLGLYMIYKILAIDGIDEPRQ